MAHAQGIGTQMSGSTSEITSFSLPPGSTCLGAEAAPNFCVSQASCQSFPEGRRAFLSCKGLHVMGKPICFFFTGTESSLHSLQARLAVGSVGQASFWAVLKDRNHGLGGSLRTGQVDVQG